jgi:hypothetical protein
MLFKKYAQYRKLLYACMFFNAALIMLGIVAFVRFVREGQARDAEMLFVGFGVLIFGVILPLILIRKISVSVKAWEIDAKKIVSEWLDLWAEARVKHPSNEGMLSDVGLWLNVALVGIESLKGRISNPYFEFVTEIAGLVRTSLKEAHEAGLSAVPARVKRRKRKVVQRRS